MRYNLQPIYCRLAAEISRRNSSESHYETISAGGRFSASERIRETDSSTSRARRLRRQQPKAEQLVASTHAPHELNFATSRRTSRDCSRHLQRREAAARSPSDRARLGSFAVGQRFVDANAGRLWVILPTTFSRPASLNQSAPTSQALGGEPDPRARQVRPLPHSLRSERKGLYDAFNAQHANAVQPLRGRVKSPRGHSSSPSSDVPGRRRGRSTMMDLEACSHPDARPHSASRQEASSRRHLAILTACRVGGELSKSIPVCVLHHGSTWVQDATALREAAFDRGTMTAAFAWRRCAPIKPPFPRNSSARTG